MADLTTTQLKLRTTPTAGVSSEQSQYYRRLLSAGYKGFLQGTVGGSTLYGAIGAGIGTVAGLALAPFTMGQSLWLIPAMGALGVYKGASTFGNIGSFAAITAESAEMNEKRRYLLDRYYDLPDSPEYDDEANTIKNLLAKQHESKAPEHMFHLRPVLVGAALGVAAALLLSLVTPAGVAVAGHFIFGEAFAASGIALHTALASAAGALIGGLSGAMIGLDRFYVRDWLDRSADLMHDTKTIEGQLREREREIAELGSSSPDIRSMSTTQVIDRLPDAPTNAEKMAPTPSTKMGAATKSTVSVAKDVAESHPNPTTTRGIPISPRVIAGLDAVPDTQASTIQHEGPLSTRHLANAV